LCDRFIGICHAQLKVFGESNQPDALRKEPIPDRSSHRRHGFLGRNSGAAGNGDNTDGPHRVIEILAGHLWQPVNSARRLTLTRQTPTGLKSLPTKPSRQVRNAVKALLFTNEFLEA
jgi:hypothetical protein